MKYLLVNNYSNNEEAANQVYEISDLEYVQLRPYQGGVGMVGSTYGATERQSENLRAFWASIEERVAVASGVDAYSWMNQNPGTVSVGDGLNDEDDYDNDEDDEEICSTLEHEYVLVGENEGMGTFVCNLCGAETTRETDGTETAQHAVHVEGVPCVDCGNLAEKVAQARYELARHQAEHPEGK